MKKLINNLLSGINNLIINLKNKNSNEVRYRIGEFITSFYIDNKETIKTHTDEIAEMLKSFYETNNFDTTTIDSEKFKKLTAWNKILTAVSDSLNKKYGGDGYGLTNLNYMQQFYRKYRNSPEMLEKALKLDWSHNIALLKDKLNEDERNFYLNRAISEKWSVKEIEQQIKDENFDNFLNEIEQNNYKFNIRGLRISNYKSLVNIEITEPSKLLVFAGANASGKSNIFEAVEFLMHTAMTTGTIVFDIFGGAENVVNYKALEQKEKLLEIELSLSFGDDKHNTRFGLKYDIQNKKLIREFTGINKLDERIVSSFSRIFIDNYKRAENKLKTYNKLWIDAANLSSILKVILENDKKKSEIIEWIQILIPEIESISIEKDLVGKEELMIIEKSYPDKPFTGNLISEGTHNIIALLALFYQTDQPQFVCIEEPEASLNPAVLSELIPFLREMTEKYHHHIWITTHSASLVSELSENELIIANKKNGATQINQCEDGDFEKMQPDEAWMSNMLKGGGLPW
jgi:predicted ATPase/predicted nuclease of restriction endonuclease-like (RecB) superfamily